RGAPRAGGRAARGAEAAAGGGGGGRGAPPGGGGGPRHSLHGAVTRGRALDPGRACSCDRIGCPAPGAHPISPAWQLEASSDPREAGRWWRERPEANIILVTGRVFDVLDVPAAAGPAAPTQMPQAGGRGRPGAPSPG